MGRFLRSVFVILGVICLLMNQSITLAGLSERPVARMAMVGVGFSMQMLSVGFIVLLQKPFPGLRARDTECLRPHSGARAARGVVFGRLLVYAGAGAAVIGVADLNAVDARGMIVMGAVMLLTAFAFVFGGVRAILRRLPADLAIEDA